MCKRKKEGEERKREAMSKEKLFEVEQETTIPHFLLSTYRAFDIYVHIPCRCVGRRLMDGRMDDVVIVVVAVVVEVGLEGPITAIFTPKSIPFPPLLHYLFLLK